MCIRDRLEDLHKRRPSQVLLSAGSDGVVLSGADGVHHVSVRPDTTVVSTSGAGDAMLSGVLAALLYGADPSEQLRQGAVIAAETVGVHSACAESISRRLVTR